MKLLGRQRVPVGGASRLRKFWESQNNLSGKLLPDCQVYTYHRKALSVRRSSAGRA
jgi:hypothetical protein